MIKGRFLGIDFGTKRIGLAISDENGMLAFPKEVVLNDKNKFTRISEVIKEENIFEIVVGESTDFSGLPNKVDGQIKTFILELIEKTGLSVHTQKEFMTSIEARRFKVLVTKKQKKDGKKTNSQNSNKVDASAAALILQRYLDKFNK